MIVIGTAGRVGVLFSVTRYLGRQEGRAAERREKVPYGRQDGTSKGEVLGLFVSVTYSYLLGGKFFQS
jgi:hypothetical protein